MENKRIEASQEGDTISRQAAIEHLRNNIEYMQAFGCDRAITLIWEVPSAQPEQEDYTEMKREFLRMASYIDCLLVCSYDQKETLMNFISRIADDMPWTERD